MTPGKQKFVVTAAKGLGKGAMTIGGGMAGDAIAKKAADAYNSRRINKLRKNNASADELKREEASAQRRKKVARTALSAAGALGGYAASGKIVNPAVNRLNTAMTKRRMSNMVAGKEQPATEQERDFLELMRLLGQASNKTDEYLKQ